MGAGGRGAVVSGAGCGGVGEFPGVCGGEDLYYHGDVCWVEEGAVGGLSDGAVVRLYTALLTGYCTNAFSINFFLCSVIRFDVSA